MSSKISKNRVSFSSWQLLIFALIFALIGGYIIYRTFATPNPNLTGDVNNDNVVNVVDLSILLSNYGKSNTTADLNGNNFTDITDLSILLTNYNRRLIPPPAAIPTSNVSITSNGFSPATISISKDTQIVWTNNDSVDHQVAADPYPDNNSIPDFDSSILLLPGDSMSFVFEQSGTFGLHDELNPNDTKYSLTVIVN